MRRKVPATVFIALLVGILGLARFAPDVRTVAAIGLFASGAAFGAGLIRLVLWWTGKARD